MDITYQENTNENSIELIGSTIFVHNQKEIPLTMVMASMKEGYDRKYMEEQITEGFNKQIDKIIKLS